MGQNCRATASVGQFNSPSSRRFTLLYSLSVCFAAVCISTQPSDIKSNRTLTSNFTSAYDVAARLAQYYDYENITSTNSLVRQQHKTLGSPRSSLHDDEIDRVLDGESDWWQFDGQQNRFHNRPRRQADKSNLYLNLARHRQDIRTRFQNRSDRFHLKRQYRRYQTIDVKKIDIGVHFTLQKGTPDNSCPKNYYYYIHYDICLRLTRMPIPWYSANLACQQLNGFFTGYIYDTSVAMMTSLANRRGIKYMWVNLAFDETGTFFTDGIRQHQWFSTATPKWLSEEKPSGVPNPTNQGRAVQFVFDGNANDPSLKLRTRPYSQLAYAVCEASSKKNYQYSTGYPWTNTLNIYQRFGLQKRWLALSTASSAELCPPRYRYFLHVCIYISNFKVKYDDVQRECEKRNGAALDRLAAGEVAPLAALLRANKPASTVWVKSQYKKFDAPISSYRWAWGPELKTAFPLEPYVEDDSLTTSGNSGYGCFYTTNRHFAPEQNLYSFSNILTKEICCDKCWRFANCLGFVWQSSGTCLLKQVINYGKVENGSISGVINNSSFPAEECQIHQRYAVFSKSVPILATHTGVHDFATCCKYCQSAPSCEAFVWHLYQNFCELTANMGAVQWVSDGGASAGNIGVSSELLTSFVTTGLYENKTDGRYDNESLYLSGYTGQFGHRPKNDTDYFLCSTASKVDDKPNLKSSIQSKLAQANQVVQAEVAAGTFSAPPTTGAAATTPAYLWPDDQKPVGQPAVGSQTAGSGQFPIQVGGGTQSSGTQQQGQSSSVQQTAAAGQQTAGSGQFPIQVGGGTQSSGTQQQGQSSSVQQTAAAGQKTAGSGQFPVQVGGGTQSSGTQLQGQSSFVQTAAADQQTGGGQAQSAAAQQQPLPAQLSQQLSAIQTIVQLQSAQLIALQQLSIVHHQDSYTDDDGERRNRCCCRCNCFPPDQGHSP